MLDFQALFLLFVIDEFIRDKKRAPLMLEVWDRSSARTGLINERADELEINEYRFPRVANARKLVSLKGQLVDAGLIYANLTLTRNGKKILFQLGPDVMQWPEKLEVKGSEITYRKEF